MKLALPLRCHYTCYEKPSALWAYAMLLIILTSVSLFSRNRSVLIKKSTAHSHFTVRRLLELFKTASILSVWNSKVSFYKLEASTVNVNFSDKYSKQLEYYFSPLAKLAFYCLDIILVILGYKNQQFYTQVKHLDTTNKVFMIENHWHNDVLE